MKQWTKWLAWIAVIVVGFIADPLWAERFDFISFVFGLGLGMFIAWNAANDD